MTIPPTSTSSSEDTWGEGTRPCGGHGCVTWQQCLWSGEARVCTRAACFVPRCVRHHRAGGPLWLRPTFKRKARTNGQGFHLAAALVATLAEPCQVQAGRSGNRVLAASWLQGGCVRRELILGERENLYAVCIAVITTLLFFLGIYGNSLWRCGSSQCREEAAKWSLSLSGLKVEDPSPTAQG